MYISFFKSVQFVLPIIIQPSFLQELIPTITAQASAKNLIFFIIFVLLLLITTKKNNKIRILKVNYLA